MTMFLALGIVKEVVAICSHFCRVQDESLIRQILMRQVNTSEGRAAAFHSVTVMGVLG